ncbi:uncharacterized protein VTP21DRAFT_2184 [Calcarisporiella thermophila]|uniref:uncharacterized protein n=1 Tax=Calcarisporiella thermophila TaxID=911321 RepID=UPI003743BAE9
MDAMQQKHLPDVAGRTSFESTDSSCPSDDGRIICPSCSSPLPRSSLVVDGLSAVCDQDQEEPCAPYTDYPLAASGDALVYPNVGELLWEAGLPYSDVRLTFDDGGRMAELSGLPAQLRLHSLILCQSEFFRRQLLEIGTSRPHPIRPKHIVVRVPETVTREDMIYFHTALKLIYTKTWDAELQDDLSTGVGVLSVCYEIGFAEGVEEIWRWLMDKCRQDGNSRMRERLVAAYPGLHKRFREMSSRSQASPSRDGSVRKSNSKRRAKMQKLQHRRSVRKKELQDCVQSQINSPSDSSEGQGKEDVQELSPRWDERAGSQSFASGPEGLPSKGDSPTAAPAVPSKPLNRPLSPAPSHFPKPLAAQIHFDRCSHPDLAPDERCRALEEWMAQTEYFVEESRAVCIERHNQICFPLRSHFLATLDAILKMTQQGVLLPEDSVEYTLRLLNTLQVEHWHWLETHARTGLPPNTFHFQPESRVVLPAYLDPLLADLILLLPAREQARLCDFLTGEASAARLQHLSEIRGAEDESDDGEEGEDSMHPSQRNPAGHGVSEILVGEKTMEAIRGCREKIL